MTQETPLISDQNSSVNSSSIQPRNWYQWTLIHSSVPVALITLVQTAVTLIASHNLGVPPNQVSAAQQNQSLLSENIKCINSPEVLQRFAHPVLMGDGAKVGATLCPTGDLALYVQPPNASEGTYRFISGQTLLGKDHAQENALMNALASIIAPAAVAMPDPKLVASSINNLQHLNQGEQIAQGLKVICSQIENNRLIRLIQYPDGSCVREVVDANTGNVLDRESGAACNGDCS